MSDVTGYYYLHTNGDMIFKTTCPELDSGFVRRVWPFIADDRACAWIICIEALALGAHESRIKELQEKWGLTDEDASEFADMSGHRIFMDGDQWCATHEAFEDLQLSQAGFGDDALHAFADFAKQGDLDKGGPVSRLLLLVQGEMT